MEQLKTFCPPGGKVFDEYGGTLTTAIGCLRSVRTWVVVESDKYCFQLSIVRLFNLYKVLYGIRVFDTNNPPERLPSLLLTKSLGKADVGEEDESGDEYDMTDLGTGTDEDDVGHAGSLSEKPALQTSSTPSSQMYRAATRSRTLSSPRLSHSQS